MGAFYKFLGKLYSRVNAGWMLDVVMAIGKVVKVFPTWVGIDGGIVIER